MDSHVALTTFIINYGIGYSLFLVIYIYIYIYIYSLLLIMFMVVFGYVDDCLWLFLVILLNVTIVLWCYICDVESLYSL